MTWRQEVRFKSGFPDDAPDTDDDDLQAGRNVAEALKAALEPLGYRVSEPIGAGHLGWELEIWRERKRFWLGISVIPRADGYMTMRNMTFWLWPGWDLYRAFQRDLQGILQADERFGKVRWYPDGGIAGRKKAAAGPFDD